MSMEIINAPWLGELHKLVKDRIDAVEDALKRAQEKHKNTVVATENGYEWTNHMGIKKQYSASGVAAMKEFVRMYEAGELNCLNWEDKITRTMWTEMAMAFYFGNSNDVFAGVKFLDVRDYIFSMIKK